MTDLQKKLDKVYKNLIEIKEEAIAIVRNACADDNTEPLQKRLIDLANARLVLRKVKRMLIINETYAPGLDSESEFLPKVAGDRNILARITDMEDLAKQAIYKKYHWIDKEYLDSFKSMYLVGWLAEYKEGNNDQT